MVLVAEKADNHEEATIKKIFREYSVCVEACY